MKQPYSDEQCEKIRNSEEYSTVKEYASQIVQERRTINIKYTSYCLKHILERYLKSINMNYYISNESFILAMYDMGYKMKQESCSPNYCFNIKVPNNYL